MKVFRLTVLDTESGEVFETEADAVVSILIQGDHIGLRSNGTGADLLLITDFGPKLLSELKGRLVDGIAK